MSTVELLKKVNVYLVGLRRALGHDHADEAWWARWGVTAGEAMALRVKLRAIADVLHVERATARGRIHGGKRFATIEEQQTWLAENARRREYAEEFVTEVGLTALP
jgi:hypothetical protein